MTNLLQKITSAPRATYRLGDLGRVVTGKTPSKDSPQDWGDEIDFITPTDFTSDEKYLSKIKRKISREGADRYKNMIVPPESVVVTCIGSDMGKVVISRNKSLTNQQINTIIVDKTVFDLSFAYYTLKSLYPTLRSIAEEGGSTMPIITKSTFENIEFEAPDITIQTEIARILSAYDAMIENNNLIIKNLELMAQTLFDEWFVKFRFPGHEKAKFMDSELGKIPDGWEVKKLGDVIELAYGKALIAEDRKDGIYPVVGSSGIVGFNKEAMVNGPGIVVGRKGNVGSVLWIEEDFYPIDTTFYVKSKLPLSYCYFILKQQKFSNGDSAVPGLGREDAYRQLVSITNRDVINHFDRYATNIFAMRAQIRNENKVLKSSRDRLLAKLI